MFRHWEVWGNLVTLEGSRRILIPICIIALSCHQTEEESEEFRLSCRMFEFMALLALPSEPKFFRFLGFVFFSLYYSVIKCRRSSDVLLLRELEPFSFRAVIVAIMYLASFVDYQSSGFPLCTKTIVGLKRADSGWLLNMTKLVTCGQRNECILASESFYCEGN